jgi:hypothetical protein
MDPLLKEGYEKPIIKVENNLRKVTMLAYPPIGRYVFKNAVLLFMNHRKENRPITERGVTDWKITTRGKLVSEVTE